MTETMEKYSVDESARRARALMNQHGLRKYSLVIEDNPYELGRTNNHFKQIRLSRQYIELNNWRVTEDTILHEIAHAHTPDEIARIEGNSGHGPTWQENAIKLGVTEPDWKPSLALGIVDPPEVAVLIHDQEAGENPFLSPAGMRYMTHELKSMYIFETGDDGDVVYK